MIITKHSTTPEALRETASVTQSLFRVAAIQMASGPQVQANLQEAQRLIELAAATGARIVALPEYFCLMGLRDADKVKARERDGSGPVQDFLAAAARRHRIWIVGGTLPLECDDERKVRNACLVYDGEGKRVARYDKIHLFGFDNGRERYVESNTIEPGTEVVAFDSPFGRIGLSVCYDLRFPELYRILALRGADLLTVPSAFTTATGRDHWEVLLRARAIENQAYVVVCNRVGEGGGLKYVGDSRIVDPLGELLATGSQGETTLFADIEPATVAAVRDRFRFLPDRR